MKTKIFDHNSLAGLDLLRFILSITILIVHFPHFNYAFTGSPGYASINDLPFKNILQIIYQYGGFAVEIFWMISGIIFYQIYLDSIESDRISFAKFIYLRFTRLYPLHLVTLCSVALLQHFYHLRFNDYFVYKHTDATHFALNLLMINFWNPKFELSFNGPFWSVSVEIFVYIVFFIIVKSKILKQRGRLFYLLIVLYMFYSLGILSPFYECLLYFFSGCFLVKHYNDYKIKQILLFIPVLVLMIILKLFVIKYSQVEVMRMINCYIQLNVAFIIVAAFLFAFDNIGKVNQKLFRLLGNVTYSTYMIHISMQMILTMAFHDYGRAFYFNKVFFIVYLLITCLLGLLVFKFFEAPAQNYLRKIGIKPKYKDATYKPSHS